ncbi:thioesterase family protein [Aeromicrobium marinum DSM 15272]|uniref:Thioesterase family protein n=1 Tax=Aeromicrobium marinum DSM 15272 TaxID=585531 RepID=E2SES3_9ACTN|nr:PaaI family thioesterase [Aeromicrobium marinum]EFQ82370.1 thioesterase family protein [Aeromicrobium marinum DSM 15272]
MRLSAESFSQLDLTTAEVEAAERLYGALTGDIRRLVDVAIRTGVDAGRVEQARELVRRATTILAEDAPPDPAGIHFNAEGRSWNWGNAVVGVRNAIAPPVVLTWDDDGSVFSEVELGVAYEGPPGCVHGGVSALVLDHLMGETASAEHTRLIVTGTLTLRYLRPLPLGTVHMRARITREDERKVTVTAHLSDAAGDDRPAVEATGLFIRPSWVRPDSVAGSLD